MKFTSVILFIFLLFASLPAYAQAAVNPEVQPQDSLSDAADAAEAEAAEEALLDELIMADSSVLEAEQQLGCSIQSGRAGPPTARMGALLARYDSLHHGARHHFHS